MAYMNPYCAYRDVGYGYGPGKGPEFILGLEQQSRMNVVLVHYGFPDLGMGMESYVLDENYSIWAKL